MPKNNCIAASKRVFALISILLSSVALPSSPAKADAELELLQARLEKAQKENLKLKAEKLEKENLVMKAEGLERENANLRAEVGHARGETSEKPLVSNTEPVKPGKAPSSISKQPASGEARYEKVRSNRVINEALNNIPRNDPRRDLTASAQVVPVSTVSPVVQQWGGVYVGINAGYGTGEVNFWSNGPSYDGNTGFGSVGQLGGTYSTSSGSEIYTGPVVGGQVGYNYELPNKVILGAEADIDYADINNKLGNGPSNFRSTTAATNGYISNNATGRTGVDWVGTARLRLGYDLGSFMPYFTGGLAYGGVSNNAHTSVTYFQDGGFSSYQSGSAIAARNSSVQVGWAAGVGGELKVADHWSIRGEYLYTSLGSLPSGSGRASYTSLNCVGCVPPQATFVSGGGATQGSIGPFGIHQARVGLNYLTGWGASPSFVSAKY